MSSLAIIPARGGSKRLKRKNILDFHGLPIISYTIKAALNSSCFDRIVVTTDDKEIFEISSNFHNDVVLRPKNLAGDDITIVDVCDNFLKKELTENKKSYDFLTVLYPTAPMRTSQDIINVVNNLEKGYTSSLAVTTFSLPVHQALIIENGKTKKIFPEIYDYNDNKIPKYYVDNGSTYSIYVKEFNNKKNLITDNLGLHIMPPERSIDIDTSFQLDLARYLYKK